MTKFTKSAAAAAAAIFVSVTLAGCGGDEKTDITTVKVGVVGEYNAQWDTVNKLLEKDKIKVELVKYSDYATPNRALSDKEIDLNAFQHKAYLANDIKRNGYKIVAIGDTLVTPLRVFNNKQKIKAIADIKDGDKIAIPADLTNGGNAFTAKLDPYADSIFSENLDPKTNPYFGQLVNVIVAREADKDNPVYKKVVAAYQTQDVAQTLKDAYKGAYVPVWPGAADYKLK